LQLGVGAKFTQADINAGFIRYTHFGATPADANFNTPKIILATPWPMVTAASKQG
jgi:hypothetical protein